MATHLSPGTVVNGYRIVRDFSPGNFTLPYEAISEAGDRVFLKQYKSPSFRVPWYQAFVDYQAELKRRIETTGARRFCYQFIDFFEGTAGGRAYFQVFEFLDKGGDLDVILEKVRHRRISWEQRLLLARVLTAGIAALHEVKIVHTDLKPPNVFLIEDPTIAAGYRLKLIDLDFSVLTDRRAPWGADLGYVGTPNYMSPEHLRAQVPLPASDVFTCGLMLYELLAQGHPFPSDTDEDYSRKINAGAPAPRFGGSVGGSAEALAATIRRCLDPRPWDRPSARDLADALMGRGLAAKVQLVLSAGSGAKPVRMGISGSIGRRILREFGSEAEFYADRQLDLETDGKGNWYVTPVANTPNETLLNGKTLAGRTLLKAGDVLAVGRASKGIAKLPLTVTFES